MVHIETRCVVNFKEFLVGIGADHEAIMAVESSDVSLGRTLTRFWM